MKNCMAFTARSFFLRLALIGAIVIGGALLLRAGGPKCVAGSSLFDSTTMGQPLTWAGGLVTFYTDQGDLSSIAPNATANTMVATAFQQWASIPTAAVTAGNAGTLAEDVNGTNVLVNADGTISVPGDIASTATGTPVGVVYDEDGSVTNALIGSGAGDPSQCFSNAVFGGADNYGSLAVYQHALIVMNGQCAQNISQLPDLQYRLTRVVGEVLGLGWSQLNLNIITGSPAPTADDYAGYPLMHSIDPMNCIPITICYPKPSQLAPDDAAAISRLYPVTAQNLPSFPGKQVFSSNTARIHGTVWFTDSSGNRIQPMQGVNVVARWIDPTTKQPSRRYAASSVSGFLFTGNEGNVVTGFTDELGDPYSEWGSDNTAVEGFFDLAGLQPGPGYSAQYQLSVEALDENWSGGVGPYAPFQVTPSGNFTPVVVTVGAGQDVQQDILMSQSAQPVEQPLGSATWSAPSAIPASGEWVGSLSPYGSVAYTLLPAQGGRTLSVAVTALDELGRASTSKAQPVIGLWAASDPPGTAPPSFTSSPFNTLNLGMTRLDTQLAASTNFIIGIADLRGDGRPDYRYRAHVLYADSVSPSRVGTSGGLVTVQGTGFAPGLTLIVGGTSVTPLTVNAAQIVLIAPAFPDGAQNITITDAVSGSSSTMTAALNYGAEAGDNIVLVNAVNPPTPVGTQAGNPVSVQVMAADGVTPVAGATVGWSATNGLQLSSCSGGSSCSVVTDSSGGASTWLTPTGVGTATITATLAPGVYSSSKSVSTVLSATESASDIGMVQPYVWIAQGATVSLPLTTRVLSNGVPQSNVKVNFALMSGAATLSAASAQSNSNGYATVNLSVPQISAAVQVSACVAPANTACAPFYAFPVPASSQSLQAVAGAGQTSSGQAFQPVFVRVTNSASPPDPVLGATVLFQTTVLRPGGSVSGGSGETDPINPASPVILQVSQSSVVSDVNGLASFVPSSGGFSAPLEVDLQASSANGNWLDYPLEVFPAPAGDSSGSEPVGRIPIGITRPVGLKGREAPQN